MSSGENIPTNSDWLMVNAFYSWGYTDWFSGGYVRIQYVNPALKKVAGDERQFWALYFGRSLYIYQSLATPERGVVWRSEHFETV